MSNAQTSEHPGFDLTRPLLASLAGLTRLGSATLYEDEIFAIVDHIPLLEDLSRTEISQLCTRMECFSAKRGDIVTGEDEEGDFLGIVLTGEVAVLKRGKDGQEKQLALIGPGVSFGELSLIDGKPRFATCVATEPTDVAILTRDSIFDILVLQPSLGSKLLLLFLQSTSQRLRETSERLLTFIGGPED